MSRGNALDMSQTWPDRLRNAAGHISSARGHLALIRILPSDGHEAGTTAMIESDRVRWPLRSESAAERRV
jgi:hypothetical protein